MRYFAVLLILSFMIWSPSGYTKPMSFDMTAFRQIPVLHEGRVKPLESFARIYMKAIYGKDKARNMSASSWLAEVLFDRHTAYQRNIFNIANPDVAHALSLEWRSDHYYSYQEISAALTAHHDVLSGIYNMEEQKRTLAQRQLLEIYFKAAVFREISHSFSLVEPLSENGDSHQTFLQVFDQENTIIERAVSLEKKDPTTLTQSEQQDLSLAKSVNDISQHRNSAVFRIIPPQWASDGDIWLSPWLTVMHGRGSPQTAEYLSLWQNVSAAYKTQNLAEWESQTNKARNAAFTLAGPHASRFKQQLEVFYHRADFFSLSLALYLLSCLLLLLFLFQRHRRTYLLAAGLTGLAAILQLTGIILRIIIMARPPVSTLYETVIFVSLIAVILALIFEYRRKDAIYLGTAAFVGSVLLFVSMGYAAKGDTMEMLIAVLDTNFWLATHVVTITMGYGCAIIAGTLAHIYLIHKWRGATRQQAAHLLNSILAVSLIALLFSLLGTILGGIWADQSWGRFWGWDPKENGALLIVLWLLWLLHGRITGLLSPVNFATAAVITNIIVALAWFGVNLLGVGLHSYGFTDSIAANLALFCGAELLFLCIMRFLIQRKHAS